MQRQQCDPPQHDHRLRSGFQLKLLGLLPALRAFARVLTGDTDRADDLVEQGLIMAFNAAQTVSPYIASKVWLFTIIHDLHFDGVSGSSGAKWRYQDMQMADYDGVGPDRCSYDMDRFRRQFWRLDDDERELLILNKAAGLSRDEVATICFCTPRGIEARVFQAENNLIYLMALHAVEDGMPLSAAFS